MKRKELLLLGLMLFIAQFYCISQELTRFTLGGNVQFSYQNPKTSTGDWEFIKTELAPKFGYYFNSHSSIGFELGLSYLKEQDYDGYGYNEVTLLQVSAFYRYQNNITEKFQYFIEPNIGRMYLKGSELIYYNFGADFGFMYYIKNRLSLELKLAGLDYNIYWVKDSEFKTKEFNLSYDLITPNLGVRYYF